MRVLTKRARCERIKVQGVVTIAIGESVDTRKKIIIPASVVIKYGLDLKC